MRKMLIGFFIPAFLGLFTVVSAQLPPEIMADKYLIEAKQLHAKEDYAEAFKVMRKIIALQKEHNLTLPDEFHFKYAQVALSTDSTRIALESVTRYLSETGREGEFYKEALAVLIEAEGTQISAEETCIGKPLGSSCWMALVDRPECYVWNPYLRDNETVTWSDRCSGNVAQGEGTLTWDYIGGYRRYNPDTKEYEIPIKEESRSTGVLRKGRAHGQWVEHVPGWVSEGPYKDGKKHGQWVYRYSYGDVSEGSYKDGKKHGQWVYRRRSGNVEEVFYVDGKRYGQWVSRYWSGAVMKGSYKDGKEHGEFYGEQELCGSGDSSLKVSVYGKYVEGKRQGDWRNDTSDYGSVGSGRYDVDGLRQGTWTFRHKSCQSSGFESIWSGRTKGDYIDGKKDGTWLYYYYPKGDWYDGKCLSTRYHQGKEVDEKEVNMKICRQADW